MEPDAHPHSRKRDFQTACASPATDSPAAVPLHVAIIGGGIGGLGAAVCLQRAGLHVTVYERDSWFADRKQGYGLTLINNPKGPLAHLGLLQECIARDCPSTAHYVFKSDGQPLGYYGTAFKQQQRQPQQPRSADTQGSGAAAAAAADDTDAAAGPCSSGRGSGGQSRRSSQGADTGGGRGQVVRGNLRVPRQDLRQMLLDRLEPGTVQWGWRLLDYQQQAQQQGVQLTFEVRQQQQQAPTISECDGARHSSTAGEGKDAQASGPDGNGGAPAPSSAMSVEQRCVQADVVVGADGLRSAVRRMRDERLAARGEPTSPLRYVGVSVILGLTTAEHPLIHQRGFYTLDGTHRLFTMPFREAEEHEEAKAGAPEATAANPGSTQNGARASTPCIHDAAAGFCACSTHDGKQQQLQGTQRSRRRPPLTMWQLSFSDVDEEQGLRLRASSPQELLQEAARRTAGWMAPVPDMVRCTPASEIWATPLYDRDPMHVYSKRSGGGGKGDSGAALKADSCVTLLGDACHPMSMFKGQGANQALEDGPLLASWLSKPGLTRSNLPTRLRCFEREMVARSVAKVHGSRAAAEHMHSPAVLEEAFGFEGVSGGGAYEAVKAALRARGVGAQAEGELDARVGEVIRSVLEEQSTAG